MSKTADDLIKNIVESHNADSEGVVYLYKNIDKLKYLSWANPIGERQGAIIYHIKKIYPLTNTDLLKTILNKHLIFSSKICVRFITILCLLLFCYLNYVLYNAYPTNNYLVTYPLPIVNIFGIFWSYCLPAFILTVIFKFIMFYIFYFCDINLRFYRIPKEYKRYGKPEPLPQEE